MKKLLTFLTLLTLFFTTAGAETVFYESFDTNESTGGNDGQWSGNIATGTLKFDNSGWGVTYANGANKCAKFGSGSYKGTATTPAITITNGAVYKLSFKAGAWNGGSEQTTLVMAGQRATLYQDANCLTEITSVSMTKGAWTTYEIYVKATDANTSIAINWQGKNKTNSRFFLDEVKLETTGGSQPTTVAVPTITLSPEGTYYEGDEVTATLACETENATIYYKLNNDDNWTEYSSALTLTETTTIHAKAVLGTDESSEKTQTVTFKKSVANIAAFKALSDADAADFKFTGDVVVTYFNENDADYLWIKDNTGSTLLYQSNLTSNVEQGDIIGGGWTGNRTIYKGLVEIKGVTDAAIAQGSETVNPIDLNYTPHFASTDYQAVYGKLSGVTCTVKNSNNSNFTITDVNGNEIAGHDTYNMWPADFSTEKTYNITGIVSVYNSAQFIPVLFEEVTEDPGDGYYLVGNFNMDGNNWVAKDARYKFSGDGTSLTLNNVTLPDDVQFKIVKWEGETQTWYGGQTNDQNQQNPYGLHRNWHTDIPLTNSYGNNYVKNFFIAGGAVTNFTLDTENLKFTVQRDAQLYFKCDKINNWEKIAMTATETGWTYSRELEAGAKFGFSDEWGDHHGNDWTLKPEHFGYSYDIPVGTENTYTMQDAGNYKLDVNSNLTVLHVNKVFNINCSANPNGGGTVVAKVNNQTVQSAMSGETVTIEYTTNNGYTFNNITLNGTALEATEGVYSFVMPSQDAEVVANYTAQSFSITVESEPGEFGTVTCPETATTGQAVTFTVTPNEGYEVLSVTASFVIGENNSPVTVSYNEETEEYSFGMPPFPVTVKVTYKAPLQPCEIPFVETWKDTNGTGGNDNTWSGTIASATIVSDNEGWEYFAGGGAKQCAKFGTSNTSGGSATTPEILVSAGTTYTMTFRAAAWNSGTEQTTLHLSAEGATLFSDANCTTVLTTKDLVKGAWTTYTVYVKATSNKMKITWYTESQKNRFFLDDVNIPKPEPVDEPTSVTLAELCQNGVITEGENWYVISDKLIAVYADATKGILWCKDMGNASIFSTSIKDGQVDFLKDDTQAQNGRDWDQSNWIALHFSTPTSTNNIGLLVSGAVNRYIKPGTIKGKLIDEVNYALRMDLDQLELVTQADDPDINPNYIPNVYCPANFMPTNLNIWGNDEDGGYTTGSTQNYFFMNPKIQEICEVTYAQWNKINGYFTVPSSSGFDGAFYIGTGYNVIESTNFTSSLQDEHIYRFKAIVQRSDKDNYGPKNDTAPATGITLYPIDLDPSENGGSDITTAINTVETGNGEVKSVKYVNVAGMVSDVPFQGVNIVVTEYTDGSRTTSKMLKK